MNDIDKLVEYIEENLRSTVNSGIRFIDPKNFKPKLLLKQNHVIFGRRGAGKSSLVSSIRGSDTQLFIYINLEDYKDISFPNIILYVLMSAVKQLYDYSKDITPWYSLNFKVRGLQKRLMELGVELKNEINRPDAQGSDITEKSVNENSVEGNMKIRDSGGKTVGKSVREKQISTKLAYDKLEEIKLTVNKYQNMFNDFSKTHCHKPIFMTLDDLYFIKKDIQPYFIDFFHRLTKGTNLYLKIATIKHRSLLYIQSGSSYVGTEIGHDIHDIDLDYTLDKFEDLQDFMRKLIEHSIIESKATEITIDNIFTSEAFKQICLASGGVPRDFLSLFLKVIGAHKIKNKKIDKVMITDAAIASIANKMSGIEKDSADEANTLDVYLRQIKNFVYTEHRTNVFLVSKPDLDTYIKFKQVLRELIDMRLIHIIDNNTSCAPSNGLRYEAYMIDVGLYDNSRPRGFNYVEPGISDKNGRKDKMRSSPRLEVGEFLIRQEITALNRAENREQAEF